MAENGKTPVISVVIPTRNEAENIRPLLSRLTALAQTSLIEILFIDDSSDHTPEVVRALQSQFEFDIRLLHRAPDQQDGLSGAVVAGFKQARGQWVGVMDADLQHPPEMIATLFEHAQNTGADLVVGSRAASLKGPKGLSPGRALMSQALTILARALFPRLLKNSSDPLTGLFLLRRQAIDIETLRPDGFKILMEILVRCPNLHVSERFFDFEARQTGSSKADFREGVRFFRHLLRLRLTADVHVTRLGIAAMISLLLNQTLLLIFEQRFSVGLLLAAVAALEIGLISLFILMESWVFFRRSWHGRWRRLFDFYLSTHLILLIVWLPVVWWASSRGRLSLLGANLAGVLLAGGLRYLFSEQWIWTRGLISRQQEPFRYNIHGLVLLESAVHIPDLSYFRVVEADAEPVDIRLLIDRHGSPSQTQDSIGYDEGLGRFGFSLAIMPGETTEVVVSPPLEKSPFVLYKNVVEPLLRWVLVRKGYALVYGGALALQGRAVLITAGPEIRKAATLLHTLTHSRCEYMADDVAILGRNGRIYSFPRLLAIRKHAVQVVDKARLSPVERFKLRLKPLIYDERVRQIGLALQKIGLPIATLNTYLQRFVPPAKIMMHRLVPDVVYRDEAQLVQVIRLTEGVVAERPLTHSQMLEFILADGKAGFGYPPYTTMVEQLSQWRGQDLTTVEKEIISAALKDVTAKHIQRPDYAWWENVEKDICDLRLTIDD